MNTDIYLSLKEKIWKATINCEPEVDWSRWIFVVGGGCGIVGWPAVWRNQQISFFVAVVPPEAQKRATHTRTCGTMGQIFYSAPIFFTCQSENFTLLKSSRSCWAILIFISGAQSLAIYSQRCQRCILNFCLNESSKVQICPKTAKTCHHQSEQKGFLIFHVNREKNTFKFVIGISILILISIAHFMTGL